MSLETALEKTYKALLIANEPIVVPVKFVLVNGMLDEAASTNPVPKQPLPGITLQATAHAESVPNSGVYEVELKIEAECAAVTVEGGAVDLDTLFTKATRPLLYRPLPAMMTQYGAPYGLQCFGMPQRGEGSGIQFGEGSVSRSITALFICSVVE